MNKKQPVAHLLVEDLSHGGYRPFRYPFDKTVPAGKEQDSRR